MKHLNLGLKFKILKITLGIMFHRFITNTKFDLEYFGDQNVSLSPNTPNHYNYDQKF